MDVDLVYLKGTAMSSSVFWSVYGFGVALGILFANVHGVVLFCRRIGIGHSALELSAFLVGLGFSVEMEAFKRGSHFRGVL